MDVLVTECVMSAYVCVLSVGLQIKIVLGTSGYCSNSYSMSPLSVLWCVCVSDSVGVMPASICVLSVCILDVTVTLHCD